MCTLLHLCASGWLLEYTMKMQQVSNFWIVVCFIKLIVTITSLTHAIICRALFHSIEVIDREDHFHLPSRHTHTHTHTHTVRGVDCKIDNK